MKKPRKRSPSLSQLKKRAWKLLSEMVRRGAQTFSPEGLSGLAVCYTCDDLLPWKELQAGHAIGGRNGAVLLDEEIIRPQCVRCNIMLRGNYGQFIGRLIREKADRLRPFYKEGHPMTPEIAALDWWERKLISAKRVQKWTRSDLLSKIQHYQGRLEALDKQ